MPTYLLRTSQSPVPLLLVNVHGIVPNAALCASEEDIL